MTAPFDPAFDRDRAPSPTRPKDLSALAVMRESHLADKGDYEAFRKLLKCCTFRKFTVFTKRSWNRVTPVTPVTPLRRLTLALVVLATFAAPAMAKDSLGVFDDWGAFRDRQVPRCYAISAALAEARPNNANRPTQAAFASVGTWPKRGVRSQLHVRLSRRIPANGAIALTIGGQRFDLSGAGGDAWAKDRKMDAAVVAAMRSAPGMSVSARDASGRRFTDRYNLAGAATAMDAATVGCAKLT